MHYFPNQLSVGPLQLAAVAPKVKHQPHPYGVIGFFVLCGLCMLNINFLTRAMFGTEQVFSILYLFACLVVLFSFKVKISNAIGAPGWFWLVAIFVYLAVSTRLGMGIERAYFFSIQSNFYRVIVAQLITVCAAMGARHLMLTGRLQLTLRILFGFTVFAASTVLLVRQFPWILQYVGHNRQGRFGGFFQDPNRAGQAICVSAAFGFGCLVGEPGKFKAVIYAGLLILVPCLLLTYSRSAIVFMAVLVMLQFIISPIIKQKGTLIGILVLAVCIPFGVNTILKSRASVADRVGQAQLEQQKSRMMSLFNILSGEFDDSDLGHRGRVAAYGLKHFYNNPVIGAGFQKLVLMPEVGLGCHNTFLRVLGEAGLFAGIIFIAAVVNIAFSGYRCQVPEIKCLVVGVIAMYSCAAMVSHSVLTSRLMNVSFGICIGFLTAAVTISRANARQQRLVRTQPLSPTREFIPRTANELTRPIDTRA